MALTALTVYLDPPSNNVNGTVLPFDDVIEYSRNERGRETVTLYVIPTPADATVIGETITIRIMKARRDRTEEVVQARVIYTFSVAPPTAGVKFEWDLRRIIYSTDNPFPMMRRGMYFISVEHSGGTTGPSSVTANSNDFRVTLLTTDRLEHEWLLGATRRSNDDRSVRFQPKILTGVRVLEVSKNHVLSQVPLTFMLGDESTPNRYLSWFNGELVPIDMSIPAGIQKQYLLVDRFETDYIVVQVDPRLLPVTPVVERLIVDRELIQRETLRRWIDEEADWLESVFLFTPIEPALCVSDNTLRTLSPSAGSQPASQSLPTNFDYDLMGAQITYFPPEAAHWITLQVPFGMPLAWEYLVGALENSRIIDINVQWIHKSSARQIQLIPFNQSLAYHFIGLMYSQAIRGAMELPSFWRYRYWAGIQEETTPLPLIETIGFRSAIKALTVLGQMFRGGVSSQSVSRDGVSESVTYTSSAMYGIYSATIGDYQKRLEALLPQIKRKYFGVYLDVL